ncbi:MAG TPA: histidinol phosphate phosphatase domain-containing protein [Thermomicrobiales bacterium]|jgi:histidinol phosphatase-like PHP family hydrolase
MTIARGTIHDFHSHTFLSDGELSPVELIRRAVVAGYATLAITDHAGIGDLQRIISTLKADRDAVRDAWPEIEVFVGVELTHLPPEVIPRAAYRAREFGAEIVNVHGETPAEPTALGTNAAAVRCELVDLLVHPGLITAEDATTAKANGIFLEITYGRGHSLTNGHVAKTALAAGANLLVNSDAHIPPGLLSTEMARKIARGAGLTEEQAEQVLRRNPEIMLQRLRERSGSLRIL